MRASSCCSLRTASLPCTRPPFRSSMSRKLLSLLCFRNCSGISFWIDRVLAHNKALQCRDAPLCGTPLERARHQTSWPRAVF